MNNFPKIPKQIKFVTQTPGDCVLACLAMISGRPLDEIKEFIPDRVGCGISAFEEEWLINQLGFFSIKYCNPLLIKNRILLVGVPSLSTPKGGHRIVIDTRDDKVKVYDPVPDHVERYTDKDFEWGQCKVCYTDVVEIIEQW